MIRVRLILATLKRVVNVTAGTVLMLAVIVLCAFLAMRVAIHGREVTVPNLSGKSDAEAASVAKDLGLNLSVENRFYSGAVAPNHVLSQSPIAGARVRRGWQVRVTESLGTQSVSVPDTTGQDEHPAALVLRRLQLEVGSVARIPAPGPAGIILTQSPPPNSTTATGPRVALLVSDDEPAGASAAYVMPSLLGMTQYAASSRLATVGLHIASSTEPDNAPPPIAPAPADPNNPNPPDTAFDVPQAPIISANAQIVSQSPLPGHRVTRADAIRIVLAKTPAASSPN